MRNKMMIKLVVGTEAMFFLSLIMAYVYFSIAPGNYFEGQRQLDWQKTAIFTVFLFSSSFTFVMAERSFSKNRQTGLKVWLLATFALGAVFLYGQGREYAHLFHHQVYIGSNLFGTAFFTLTAFHGFHVIVGLILIMLLISFSFSAGSGLRDSSLLSCVGIYWHFVDIVWLVVFSIIYVLPHFKSIG